MILLMSIAQHLSSDIRRIPARNHERRVQIWLAFHGVYSMMIGWWGNLLNLKMGEPTSHYHGFIFYTLKRRK